MDHYGYNQFKPYDDAELEELSHIHNQNFHHQTYGNFEPVVHQGQQHDRASQLLNHEQSNNNSIAEQKQHNYLVPHHGHFSDQYIHDNKMSSNKNNNPSNEPMFDINQFSHCPPNQQQYHNDSNLTDDYRYNTNDHVQINREHDNDSNYSHLQHGNENQNNLTHYASSSRPQAVRLNTAPSYAILQPNREDTETISDEKSKNNKQSLFTQNSVYFQKQPVPKAKRGRPKKKPGFHLNLEGISKKPIHNRQITSSQSDSGTDYWNRTPGSSKNFAPQRISFKPIEQQRESSIEKELELPNSYGQNSMMIPSFNLTPSIEPPSGNNGYFDMDNTPKSTVLNSGGFFSPAINKNSENTFNQTFEDYLKDLENDLTRGKFEISNKNNQKQSQASHYQNQNDTSSQEQPQTLNEVFAPLIFETLGNSHLESTSTNEFFSPDDGNHSYLSSNEEKNPQQLLSFKASGDDEHEARLSLPLLQRTTSNHSNNSKSSVGSESAQIMIFNNSGESNNQTKPTVVKKRALKGAVCQVCNKFISRDLTRHMRIHNEIGRFQCVYPKHMCNHKTQNFNRPYDYKKHLLHRHFIFDDPEGKSANKLTDKLPLSGACSACGVRFVATEWLDDHVLTKDFEKRCPYVDETFLDLNSL